MARIVFDLDGTLIHSAPEIQFVANSLLADRRLEPLTLAETISFIGNGAAVLIEKMSIARGIPADQHAELLATLEERYMHSSDKSEVFAGVLPALEALQGLAIGWGCVRTNPWRLRRRCWIIWDWPGFSTWFWAVTVWMCASLIRRRCRRHLPRWGMGRRSMWVTVMWMQKLLIARGCSFCCSPKAIAKCLMQSCRIMRCLMILRDCRNWLRGWFKLKGNAKIAPDTEGGHPRTRPKYPSHHHPQRQRQIIAPALGGGVGRDRGCAPR